MTYLYIKKKKHTVNQSEVSSKCQYQDNWDTIHSLCSIFLYLWWIPHASGRNNRQKWCLRNFWAHNPVYPVDLSFTVFLIKQQLCSHYKHLPKSSSISLSHGAKKKSNHSVFLYHPYISKFLADWDMHSLLTESYSPNSTDLVYFTSTNVMQSISKHTELQDGLFSSGKHLTKHILCTSLLT